MEERERERKRERQKKCLNNKEGKEGLWKRGKVKPEQREREMVDWRQGFKNKKNFFKSKRSDFCI